MMGIGNVGGFSLVGDEKMWGSREGEVERGYED